MKKFLKVSILSSPMFILSAQQIYAEDGGLNNPLKGINNIWELIAKFIPVVAGMIGIGLLGYLLYGAYLWMTAADKPDQVEGAKKTLTNAVIGFALFGVGLGLFFFLSAILQINWRDIISGVANK